MSFNIREATPADVPALADLHVKTFIETHGGDNPPTVELRERQWREIIDRAGERDFIFLIEDSDGGLVGFARGVPYNEPEPPGYTGLLNKIYLLRRYHRQGLGRRLLGHVTRRFLRQGIDSILLFGDADNPTNGFYEHMGAERLITAKGEFHGGYGWRDLNALAAECPID
jgi:ribosomal protein S18 acetylase RimI-like enzyme